MDNTTLHIDRTTPLDLTTFGDIGHYFDIAFEDPDALHITDINVSKIEIKPILAFQEQAKEGMSEAIDTQVRENIHKLKDDGYIFLDAKVLEALLRHPEAIPQEWTSLSTSENALEFHGTQIKHKETGELCVMTLSFERGWNIGYTPLQFSKKDEMLIWSQDGPRGLVQYSRSVAVYRPA